MGIKGVMSVIVSLKLREGGWEVRADRVHTLTDSADVLAPVGIPGCVDRLYALMEDGAAPPGLSSAAGAPRRGWWVDKDDEDAVYLTVLMLGLGKERVKVWAERNILVIKGGGEKAHRKGDSNPALSRYSHRIEMPAGEYKMDKIKAEMKNFVLKVTVPKLKEEERMDVFQEWRKEQACKRGTLSRQSDGVVTLVLRPLLPSVTRTSGRDHARGRGSVALPVGTWGGFDGDCSGLAAKVASPWSGRPPLAKGIFPSEAGKRRNLNMEEAAQSKKLAIEATNAYTKAKERASLPRPA
ncbi:hypothetical protein TRIUR3_20100 [Triticum urartu]|uniref:Uncharacterized protein n=1 Tax=Triticum urartu TaxID=4572 RepID=M7ZIJ1_TRIUA|nr:hypothetical protein TRIUR3_20100 [Triticum urartu]